MKNTISPERLDDRLLKDLFLRLVPGLPSAVASSLSSASEQQQYAAGQLIIREGEPSSGIFLLTSGTVQTVVSKPNYAAGRQVSLHKILALAVIGVSAAMLAESSAVSIVALTTTEAAFIPRADFMHVLGQFPQAALAFSQLIASELADTYSHLSQLRSVPRSAGAPAPAS